MYRSAETQKSRNSATWEGTVNNIPLVRASAILPFVHFLDGIGAPVERLMEDARLSPRILEQPERLHPLHQGLDFVDRAARREGIEHLGLVVGERTSLRDLGAFGVLVTEKNNLCEAIHTVIDAVALENSAERVWLECRGERVRLCHAFCDFESAGQRHGDLFTITLLINLLRLAASRSWVPDTVEVPASEGARRKSYKTLLRTRVSCRGRQYAIEFDRALLDARLVHGNGMGRQLDDLYAFLSSTGPATDFPGRVRQVIEALFGDGSPPLALVAAVTGFKARTLQRRLAEGGVTFSQLVEEARRSMALTLLQAHGIKLVDVALDLGYSDNANFVRAFKRWTGSTPGAIRKSLARNGPQAICGPPEA
jgi:AraC-like DNA-binding protein